jgi:hypothetical protein
MRGSPRKAEISRHPENTDLSDWYLFIKEAIMTNKEMRDVVKALNVELFKMNYKAGVRLPNLEAFLAGDDDAFAYDPKAKDRLEKMLEQEVKASKKK